MPTDPGLDMARLRRLRPPRHDATALIDRIADHLDAHDGYVAFSTGKDSTVALHLARQADPAVPVVFFDSGLEYPETYQHLHSLTEAWTLNLHVVPARVPLLQVLVDSGAWDHHAPQPEAVPNLFDLLIGEPSRRAHTAHGPGEIWGVRAAESKGRAAAYANALRAETDRSCPPGCCPDRRAQRHRHGGVIHRADGTHVLGPVWNWSDTDIWTHLDTHRLPVNPVYSKLAHLGAPPHAHRVSHLFDGHRVTDGRLVWLRRGWPTLFDEIATALPRIREYA